MDAAHDYNLGEVLHEGRHGRIYAGVRRSDGREVVSKVNVLEPRAAQL